MEQIQTQHAGQTRYAHATGYIPKASEQTVAGKASAFQKEHKGDTTAQVAPNTRTAQARSLTQEEDGIATMERSGYLTIPELVTCVHGLSTATTAFSAARRREPRHHRAHPFDSTFKLQTYSNNVSAVAVNLQGDFAPDPTLPKPIPQCNNIAYEPPAHENAPCSRESQQ
jgi:hypothetical protein